MRENVILTGLPRGGTTLTCHLLNKLPDAVALHEPIPPARFAGLETEEAVLESLESFYKKMRRMIERRGVAFSKPIRRRVTDHSFDPRLEAEVRRQRSARGKTRKVRGDKKITVEKPLGPAFMLVIKSPALFSAFLPALVKRFPAYAVIRNPLAILASWDSWDNTTRNGHSPAAERYDELLRHELASIEDRVGRQLRLMSWFFERFEKWLPEENVLRYEALTTSGGKALSTITPAALDLNEPLESRNLNPVYDRDYMLRVGERLLESEGAYWRFYPRASVEDLLIKVD